MRKHLFFFVATNNSVVTTKSFIIRRLCIESVRLRVRSLKVSSVSLSDTFRIFPLVLNSDARVWSSEGDLWSGSYDVDTAKIISERQRKLITCALITLESLN
jgi:hypothetical protein